MFIFGMSYGLMTDLGQIPTQPVETTKKVPDRSRALIEYSAIGYRLQAIGEETYLTMRKA